MTDNPWDHPDFIAWAARVRNQMFPKMEDSAANIALLPAGDPDVKLAVEVGYGIMLDKPLIVLVLPGAKVSEKLRAVADRIIEVDIDKDPEGAARAVQEAMREVVGP